MTPARTEKTPADREVNPAVPDNMKVGMATKIAAWKPLTSRNRVKNRLPQILNKGYDSQV
jgi:hypothetical protein